jgi:hypothetical protein
MKLARDDVRSDTSGNVYNMGGAAVPGMVSVVCIILATIEVDGGNLFNFCLVTAQLTSRYPG